MVDERSLCWELFFPAECRFEGIGLPAGLARLLEARRTPGPRRVLVAYQTEIEVETNLYEYDGIVAIGAGYSESRLRTQGFRYFGRYVALPSLADLRWLVPLASRAVASGALGVYTPFRRKARLQRQMLRMALRLGRLPPRAQTVTIISRQEPALLQTIGALLPEEEISLAVSTGTPGPARKPTVAALDSAGKALAFGKVATSGIGESLLRNEAAALTHIAADADLCDLAPRLLYAASVDGRFLAVQSALSGSPAPAAFGEAERRFLQALSAGPVRPAGESAFLRTLLQRVSAKAAGEETSAVLWRAIRELAQVELPRTLLHGDFAPWNLRVQNDGIVAFDWEYASPDALPGLDELHHLWQAGHLLRGWNPAQARAALDAWADGAPFGLERAKALALTDIYLVHGILQRLETGCDEGDALVRHYHAALAQRAATAAVPA